MAPSPVLSGIHSGTVFPAGAESLPSTGQKCCEEGFAFLEPSLSAPHFSE